MRTLLLSLLTVGLFSFLASCSYKQDQLLFEQRGKLDSVLTKISYPQSYRIQVQDILQVKNLQNINYIIGDAPSAGSPSSAGSGGATTQEGQNFQVDEEGYIALPVLGHVQVMGLTRMEVSHKIEDLYRKNLLKDPIIDVKIVNLKVTILGEIKAQGNYPLIKDKTTLVELLGEAGGLTDKANSKNIEIIRGAPAHPVVTRIDLGDISSLSDPAAILQNGDIIYIAQNKRAIQSDKVSTFSTIIQPALIILNTVLIIFTLARR